MGFMDELQAKSNSLRGMYASAQKVLIEGETIAARTCWSASTKKSATASKRSGRLVNCLFVARDAQRVRTIASRVTQIVADRGIANALSRRSAAQA
jgi:hypothetical protein